MVGRPLGGHWCSGATGDDRRTWSRRPLGQVRPMVWLDERSVSLGTSGSPELVVPELQQIHCGALFIPPLGVSLLVGPLAALRPDPKATSAGS